MGSYYYYIIINLFDFIVHLKKQMQMISAIIGMHNPQLGSHKLNCEGI